MIVCAGPHGTHAGICVLSLRHIIKLQVSSVLKSGMKSTGYHGHSAKASVALDFISVQGPLLYIYASASGTS